MARIRNIKPSFFTDADLCELPPLHRLLFIGLWCHADKAGALEDKPRELKVQIFPFDDCDLDAMLWDLAERHFIDRYEAEMEGKVRRFIFIWNFATHQRVHKEEKASKFPRVEAGRSLSREISVEAGKTSSRDGGLTPTPSPSPASVSPSPASVPALQKKPEDAQARHTPATQVPAPSVRVVTEPTFKSPEPNVVRSEVSFWQRCVEARLVVFPQAIPEPPPANYAAWWPEALRAVRSDEERLFRGYRDGFLKSAYWGKQACPARGWFLQWREFIPDQAAPREPEFRLLKPGEDPYADELPEHLKQAQAVKA